LRAIILTLTNFANYCRPERLHISWTLRRRIVRVWRAARGKR